MSADTSPAYLDAWGPSLVAPEDAESVYGVSRSRLHTWRHRRRIQPDGSRYVNGRLVWLYPLARLMQLQDQADADSRSKVAV